MRVNLLILCAVLLPVAFVHQARAQAITPYAYDIGSPAVVDYYISPTMGADSNSGTSRTSPWRTVLHAWQQIPREASLSQGYRMNLMNGVYSEDDLPNYWELRKGTAQFPIIIRAAEGQTSVRFAGDINMAHVSYFYLIGIVIEPEGGGDAFHCEQCDHLLLRGVTLNGGQDPDQRARETLKVNQSTHVYIENSNISGASDNAIDFVAVQYGHIIGNRVHSAQDWCAYVKGGSSYLRVEANYFFNCGTGGFTAGQGTGFQFMTPPWIHFEAYDIKFINNVIYNTEGAAFGVNGGYNILFAHNTAYGVGSRSHLVEVVFGERSCDGEQNGQPDAGCFSRHAAGGWGPAEVRQDGEPLGNRNVFILNNILFNPESVVSSQHFAIYGPRTNSGDLNLPSPQHTDSNLVIRGNLVFNGPEETPLGIEDSSQGCQPGNGTCTLSQLTADNLINDISPQFQAAAQFDLRPSTGSNILSASAATLESFAGGDRESTPLAPLGVLSNAFDRDFSGAQASGSRIIGAFQSPNSSLIARAISGISTPPDPSDEAGDSPTIARLRVRAQKTNRGARLIVQSRVDSATQVSGVSGSVRLRSGRSTMFSLGVSGSRYTARVNVRARQGARLTVRVEATNQFGMGSRTVRVRVP